MTAFDRFDPLDHRVARAIDEIAVARRPDYLDDVLGQTARMRQRPRWTFLGRWIPMETIARPVPHLGVPIRPLLILALLALLAAAVTILWAGAQRDVPPFGLAGNGAIVYAANGDLYSRDSLAGQPRLLIGGSGEQGNGSFSPNGQWLSYTTTAPGVGDQVFVARADGAEPRMIALIPWSGNAQGVWAPDSRSIALIYDVAGRPTLSITPIDGSPPIRPALGDLQPLDPAWRPPDGRELLVRALNADGRIELVVLDVVSGSLRHLALPSPLRMGTDWDLTGATWSTDGSRIAYNTVDQAPAGAPYPGLFRVHVVLPDGTRDLPLPAPSDPRVQEAWPAFSPDGRSILVHRWTWKEDRGGEGWIAVMPADGSAAARDLGPKIAGGQDTAIEKAWSPDGTRVLMSANTAQVYSIDPATGDQELLDWAKTLPDWQRTVR